MTVEPTIDYEGLAQEAMRGVVRTVLVRTAKSGLAGDHHFYISFDTEAPGVTLSKRLKEKYPREMTIVLQHRFWDLIVSDERFEVKLTFDGIPERLVVPFQAIKVFFDPSVRFGLQFEDPNAGGEGRAQPGGSFDNLTTRSSGTRSSQTRKSSRTARKPRSSEDGSEAVPAPAVDAPSPAEADAASSPKAVEPAPVAANGADDERASAENEDGRPPRPAGGAEIVSLDKFRKK